jgi:hypothetical protein
VPENVRIGGRVAKGYQRHQFEDAWATYLAPVAAQGEKEPLHRYNADEIRTSGTFRNATGFPGVAVRKSQKPPSNGHCSGVAVEKGVAEGEESSCAHCGCSNGTLVFASIAGEDFHLHPECETDYLRGGP